MDVLAAGCGGSSILACAGGSFRGLKQEELGWWWLTCIGALLLLLNLLLIALNSQGSNSRAIE